MRIKLISLMLALILSVGVAMAAPAYDYFNLVPAVRTQAPNCAGKTIILHTNDVHGALSGYACLPALKAQYLKQGATDVILADDGDFLQGDIYVSVNKGEAAVTMMNAVGYDVVTLGNHEFDYGLEQLQEDLSKAQFPVICCNVYLKETGELLLPPSKIIETRGGMKLGFVGVETPETASKANPVMTTDVSFSSFDALYEATQKAVDDIRGDCDLVIALAHLGVSEESVGNGYRSVDLMDRVEGIDFVVDGHSHTVMTADEKGRPVQSTGTKFAYVGVVVIDDATRTVEDHYLLDTSKLGVDKDTAAIAQKIIDDIDALYDAPFATSDVVLNGEQNPGNRTEETNLGDLICDAVVWNVVKEGGIEQAEPSHVVGIFNGGGIRATIDPGDISKRDIVSAMPFNNTVAVDYVTGAELLEALEASTFCTPDPVGGFPQTSGIDWTIDTTVPYEPGELYYLNGEPTSYYGPAAIRRVTINAINGEPFDPDATYAVIANDYIAIGGDTYNAFSRAYNEGAGFDTGIFDDDVVAAYIQEVLNGEITEAQYGQPRGSLTIILPEDGQTDAAAQPVA